MDARLEVVSDWGIAGVLPLDVNVRCLLGGYSASVLKSDKDWGRVGRRIHSVRFDGGS